MKKEEYPKPAYTADNVIVKNYKVLLIKRKNDPFKNCWALPGGYVNENETGLMAAIREAKEEINVDLSKLNPEFIGIYDAPNRDPRGWVISAAYGWDCSDIEVTYKAGDDAKEAKWFDLSEVDKMELAFDHNNIIKQCQYFKQYFK
jgi:8-oxo-dGTP diphosphatase